MVATANKLGMKVRFSLGRTVATPGALAALEEAGEIPFRLFWRHERGDWGCVCQDDAAANEQSLVDGSRILSAYTLKTGVKVWLITEADRSATTILLPEEY